MFSFASDTLLRAVVVPVALAMEMDSLAKATAAGAAVVPVSQLRGCETDPLDDDIAAPPGLTDGSVDAKDPRAAVTDETDPAIEGSCSSWW